MHLLSWRSRANKRFSRPEAKTGETTLEVRRDVEAPNKKNAAGANKKYKSPTNPCGVREQDNNVYVEMDRKKRGRSHITDKYSFFSSQGSVYRLDACQPYSRPPRLRPRDFHCQGGSG